MEKINKISSKARVTEINGAATNIIDLYSKTTLPEDATLTSIMDELKLNNDSLTISINKDKGIAETEKYDALRDEAYQNLHHFVYGMTKLPNSNDAQTLWSIITRYGLSITKEAYAEETSKINSLLEELDGHQTELTAVAGAITLVETLRTAQTDFQNYYSTYIQSITDSSKTESASTVKTLVVKSINTKLVVYLRTQAEFNAENYGDFVNDVALIIDKTNENVKERTAK